MRDLAPIADSFAAWLGAVSALLLGLLGLVVTVWQWRQTGFRPRFKCRIDERRQAIEVRIENRGRAAGRIEAVMVVRPAMDDAELHRVTAEQGGKRAKSFGPWELPPFASMRVIIRVTNRDVPFPESYVVKVEWGADGEFFATPETALDVSFYRKEDVLPSGPPKPGRIRI